jgi:hypothetical protein
MIDMHEIRFDNVVLYKNEPHIIWGFGANEVMIKDINDNMRTNPVSNSDIEGMPLTPELLEACGFEKAEYNGMEQWLSSVIQREQPLTRSRLGIMYGPVIGFYYQTDIMQTKITYLHQLQNLYYALTGTELEVKLPTLRAQAT